MIESSGNLKGAGHDVLDFGTHDCAPVDDYAGYARLVGHGIQSGETERGIIVCGSGVGACVAANKLEGIRACLCYDTYSVHQGVEHDDINVLCLGARIVGSELALELVRAFWRPGLRARNVTSEGWQKSQRWKTKLE